ncbi:MAG: NADH-quinone oxidoreductase subunit J, partial [Thermodesulfobacteriota bacterium]
MDILFYIFAAASVAGALLVVTHNNPVVSALSLVLTLFSTAVLFVFLLAHFIAAIQILV